MYSLHQKGKSLHKLNDCLKFSFSQDEIEGEEDGELSSPTSDNTASTTTVPRSSHDCDKRKPFRSRFFKSTKEKYIDYNDNVADTQPELLPHIASKRSLSTEDLPRNLERYSGHYDIESNSQEPYFCYSHSNTKRESFDSTVAQRPFSPCSTLAASDQFSVCEDDIVLMSPRFRGISSQRRASDGMVQRIPVQWPMQESNQGLSSSFTDVNGTCSRASSRPATPATPTVSPLIKIKASGGFKLPPLNAPNPRRPKLQELPSITISDKSGSGSQGSLESFPDEQPCTAAKRHDQTYLNPTEVRLTD